MTIALLVLLDVNLIEIVVLLTRRRWVSHQPGAFKGAVCGTDDLSERFMSVCLQCWPS
jgi:hypothetical protein